MSDIDYRLYLVTDEPSRYTGNWLDNVMAAVEGGVTVVQYRDTQSNGRMRYERAKALNAALAVRHIPLIINDDAALAVAVNAAGVHVGKNDLPVREVRRVVGPHLDIGWSVTCAADLETEDAQMANLLGIGPVYDARSTKPNAAPEMGVAGFRELLALAGDKRVTAIGGITPERGLALVRAGAESLAIVSAFSRANDPRAIARQFSAYLGNRNGSII